MNRKSLYFVLPLIVLALMSCRFGDINVDLNREIVAGSGTLKTETRAVQDVERVTIENFGDMTIIQGDTESLTIEADDNLLPYLVSEMQGRELVLKFKDGYELTTDSTIRYTLRVKSLNRVSVAGAANVRSDALSAKDLALNVAGAGNINITGLQAENLRCETSGTGNFDLKGSVNSQTLTINGAGNYSAGDLESGESTVTINGTGNVTVWAKDRLNITVNGFGSVGYYGSPRVTQSITGGGEVNELGARQ